jgi:hypothetical protein
LQRSLSVVLQVLFVTIEHFETIAYQPQQDGQSGAQKPAFSHEACGIKPSPVNGGRTQYRITQGTVPDARFPIGIPLLRRHLEEPIGSGFLPSSLGCRQKKTQGRNLGSLVGWPPNRHSKAPCMTEARPASSGHRPNDLSCGGTDEITLEASDENACGLTLVCAARLRMTFSRRRLDSVQSRLLAIPSGIRAGHSFRRGRHEISAEHFPVLPSHFEYFHDCPVVGTGYS